MMRISVPPSSRWGLAAFYRRSPDELSEEEVRAYLLELRRRGAARGTFEIARAGLRFLFCQTLDRVWALFGEKRIALPRRKRLPELIWPSLPFSNDPRRAEIYPHRKVKRLSL